MFRSVLQLIQPIFLILYNLTAYMSRKYQVYGIGNALMDLQLQISEQNLTSLELKKGGMQLVTVEEQHRLLKEVALGELHQASGGSAANSIIALQQLGGRGAYGCLVGEDRFGLAYKSELEKLGVFLPNQPCAGKTTGTCLVLITPDAERTMNTALGVSAEIAPEHGSESTIAESEWLYIEGYLFSSSTGQATALHAARLAKKHQTKVAVTFSDTFIVTVFGEALREVVALSDLVFANCHEAQAFAGSQNEDLAFSTLMKAAPHVVMTLSERGVRLGVGGEEFFSKPFPVKAIDNTGAGDMFAGAYLYGLNSGFTPEKSAELACFLASRVVSQLGPRLATEKLNSYPELQGLVHSQQG